MNWSHSERLRKPVSDQNADIAVGIFHGKSSSSFVDLKLAKLVDSCGWILRMKTEGKIKTPFEIRMADELAFCIAGIWEAWKSPDGSAIESTTMITTEPNELMEQINDRMPVILPIDLYGPWLDPAIDDADTLQSMLASFPAELMKAAEVKKDISSIKFHDDPRLPISELEFATGRLAKRRTNKLF